jgi:uncharacterized protein YkwD
VVHVQADRSVRTNESVRVLVLRVSAARPVTIRWGDGASTQVRSACTTSQAARHPRTCGTMARHTYATPGSFRLVVSRNPISAYRALLTVAAATSSPAGKPATSTPGTSTPGTSERITSAAWRNDMLAQVNALRQQAGVGPVTLCANLTAAAQDYASIMATKNHYGHVGLDGSQPWDRMTASGYAWQGAGENIAGGFDTTSAVMAGWRASPHHYDNLVNPSYTHLGLGRASDPSSTYHSYWVQDFGYGGACPS